jgi:two-component system, NarL family, sensor kinase
MTFFTSKFRQWTLFLVLVASYSATSAQASRDLSIDSLIRALPAMMRSDEATARSMIGKLEQKARAAGHRHGLVQAAFFKAWISYRHDPPEKAISAIDSALRHVPGIGQDTALVKFYILKGQCYVKKVAFSQALAQFNTALKIARERSDRTSATSTLISIGWAYMENGKPKDAVRFFGEVLELNPDANYEHRAVVLCNMASCYNTMGDFRQAERYAQQGIATARSRENHSDLGNGLNILGRAYYMQGKIEAAIRVLQEGARSREKVADPSMLASDYLELADLYSKSGNPRQAIVWAAKSEAVSSGLGNGLKLKDAYKALAENYEAVGDSKMALHFLKKLQAQRDSFEADRYNKAFAEMQVQFETQKKTAENLRLRQENLEARLRNSVQQRWLLLLAGLVLLLTASGIYISKLLKSRYQTKLALEQLSEQRQRTQAVMEAEENERRRIAGELHDGVAQTLAAAALQLDKAIKGQPTLDRVDDLIGQAGTEIRALSHRMTPELLLHHGLAQTVAIAIEKLNDANDRVRFTLYTHLESELRNDLLALSLYRSFQELCTNVLKHADATEVAVHLTIDPDEVQLIVEDNGKGFDVATATPGLGLRNLNSRIAFYGGNVVVDSTPGKGSTTIIKVTHSASLVPETEKS